MQTELASKSVINNAKFGQRREVYGVDLEEGAPYELPDPVPVPVPPP